MSANTGARPTLAVFVSSHGFGHASRSCAVLEQLCDLEPRVQVELFTRIPEWFFASLGQHLHFHELDCDLGLVQTDAFEVATGPLSQVFQTDCRFSLISFKISHNG